jgi:hypothetical protein
VRKPTPERKTLRLAALEHSDEEQDSWLHFTRPPEAYFLNKVRGPSLDLLVNMGPEHSVVIQSVGPLS